ncbi:MAG: GspE/PulE family protein [Patescibacteria group bacterium]
MILSEKELREILIKPGHIDEADFKIATEEAEDQQTNLADVLISRELIKDEQLGQLVADKFGFDYINLKKEKIDEKALNLIPEIVASSKGVIPFSHDKDVLKVGMTDPRDLEIIHLIKKRVGQIVQPYYITANDLQNSLELYKGSIKDEFKEILTQLNNKSLVREQSDELIVKMVDQLFFYGQQSRASDIHLEPSRNKTNVRFRIDGVMHKVLELPKDLSELIITRIKILAKIRTDEHRAAQDGKLRFKFEDEVVDVRVSIVPIVEGENVVMRLLSAKSRQFSLTDLGFSSSNLKKILNNIKSPHGMILVTGPTGSGKTTTLYAILKILNNPKIHISTIEDPVEYDIEGVSQIQVNSKTNLTFAKGLRAIVRQDPDIIMVGEIRDKETAGIAVNSALTGHLVLSTLHTNDSATTLPRLIDMSVEPYLVASTINIVVAQRLVRKICEKCRASYNPDKSELKILSANISDKKLIKNISQSSFLYKGKGCKVCGQTGYTGRIGLFEVLEISEEIKELIIKVATSDKIMAKAKEQGMRTMLEDGIEKALNGMTTLDEILRVAKG